MPETGTPTLEELAVDIDAAAYQIIAAVLDGRFEDVKVHAQVAWRLADDAHAIELAASLEP